MNPTDCTECDNQHTTTVDTELHTHMIRRIMICDECETEWTIVYGSPDVLDVINHA